MVEIYGSIFLIEGYHRVASVWASGEEYVEARVLLDSNSSIYDFLSRRTGIPIPELVNNLNL